jgi:type IV pilus assembly protein PilC
MNYEEWLIAHARVKSKPRKQLTFDDKLTFFHQLATLVNAGTPLLRAIQIVAEQSESTTFRQVLNEIAARLSAGSSLHAAAGDYPKVFDYSWVEVIKTGEITGKMGHVLLELNKQVRESRETQRKIRGAMTYPIILLCVAVLAITAMLWFVVPTFTQMFKEMGAKLPEITQFVVSASEFVVKNGLMIMALGAVAGFLFRRYANSEDGRRKIGSILLVTPTLGDLMIQMNMYRFTSNISLLLNSGVPMLETLGTLQGIMRHNPIYRDALGRVQGRVAAGQPLATSLEETGLFASMLVNMVNVGEESGQLASVMGQIAPYYKEKMETLIGKASKILEPIIIVGMGIAVAVMMLSIYMPMFEMSGNVK